MEESDTYSESGTSNIRYVLITLVLCLLFTWKLFRGKKREEQNPLTEQELKYNEEFARKRGLLPIAYDTGRRPINAQEEPDTCPICLETLFDQDGVSEKDIAEIMCLHLVHSDCLAQAGRAMNASGERYGIGGLGPRGGCPVCEKAVSFWVSSKQAADFPVFWMHRIQTCLEEIGPDNGPVPIKDVKHKLRHQFSLTSYQKKVMKQSRSESGFEKALQEGAYVNITLIVNGGPARGGGISVGHHTPGIWDFDERNRTLYLAKWQC